MKNLFRAIGLTALVAVIGFSIIACDNGTGGGGRRGPFNPGSQQPADPATYVYDDGNGNKYELVITEAAAAKAAIIRALDPNKNYEYTLTITIVNDPVKKISKGTVASVTGVTIVLQPTGSETTVTVTVSGTGNTGTIISIYSESGTIPVDEGDDVVIPEALTPNPSGEQPGHTHVWGEWVVTTPATETENGEETRTCALDSSHKETRVIPATGEPGHTHQWGNWIVTRAATCTEAGEETRTCADPSHQETHPIEALGHDWGNWTVTTAATETTDGVETRTCSRDATHKETRPIPATGTPGLAYGLNNNGTAYSVSAGTARTGAVTIPATYNGLPVTTIGARAFYNTAISSVTIPSSVTSIGNNAFERCTSLTSITIPSSVTSISDYAFRDCLSLTSVTIPSSVTSIGREAFAVCSSLTSITIPVGVTSIGNNAFLWCESLPSVTIPSSVTSIGVGAFESCSSLTSITIPASVTSIGYGAFSECTSLTSITVDASNPNYASEEGILYNKAKTTLIAYPSASGAVTIPSSVTSIGRQAFDYCNSLTSVTIPSSVTSIGPGAFEGCTSLTSVTIPSSVTSIGWSVFWGWTFSQTINVQGKADRAATIAAGWDSDWDYHCDATINYNAP